MVRREIDQDATQAFRRDGYVVVRGMLSAEGAELVARAAHEDRERDSRDAEDVGANAQPRLRPWGDPPEAIYGAATRSRSLVEAAERLVGEEVYHLRSNLALKEARTAKATQWHQDSVQWRRDGLPGARLVEAMVAIDPATRDSGCLELIRGSHARGAVAHHLGGAAPFADPARVAQLLREAPSDVVEMAPGDALFFHADTLHRSGVNETERSRWALFVTYNAKSNAGPGRLSYRRLVRLPDEAVVEAGRRRFGA